MRCGSKELYLSELRKMRVIIIVSCFGLNLVANHELTMDVMHSTSLDAEELKTSTNIPCKTEIADLRLLNSYSVV